jgi:hypothetical protein
MMVSGISASVAGLSQSYERMASAAHTIASAGSLDDSEVLSAILDLRLASHAAGANAAALRIQYKTLGSLLDILA